MNNTNEAVLFNTSFKKQNFKQKQCQDCLREAYLHKLLSNSFVWGGGGHTKLQMNKM